MEARRRKGPLVSSGVLLGAGLGGFFDGILLHQILQWHNMLAARIPPVDLVSVKVNMFWDGLFHAATWTLTVVGLGLLWRALARTDGVKSGRVLLGSLALGWGLFNAIEGVIDHQILGLHHVHPGEAQLAWDLGFIASGLISIAIGVALIRSPARADQGQPGQQSPYWTHAASQ